MSSPLTPVRGSTTQRRSCSPTHGRSLSVRCPVAMIKIAITAEAFEAIARTLALGSVGYEAEANERGERVIWIERFQRVSWSG